MCREILNTCVRNTEEAERSAQGQQSSTTPPSTTASGAATPTSATTPSGRGHGKGVWNMIEESELAKSIKKDDQKKVRTVSGFSLSSPSSVPDKDGLLTDELGGRDVDVGAGAGVADVGDGGAGEQTETELVDQAKEYKTKLDSMLSTIQSSSSSSSSSSISNNLDIDIDVVDSAKRLLPSLAKIISSLSTATNPTVAESTRLADMLELNDGLTDLIGKAAKLTRPNLKLQGLGLEFEAFDEREGASGSGSSSGVVTPSGSSTTAGQLSSSSSLGSGSGSSSTLVVVSSSNGTANGHAGQDTDTETETEDEGPKVETPRVDKGKGRAIPEPEEPERVLSPSGGFGLESDEEVESGSDLETMGLGVEMDEMGVVSPTDR